VLLDIRAALEQAYDAGDSCRRIDDRTPCEPPLDPEDQAWAGALTIRAES
jgi:hypothetical protein